jgi:alkylation response protein AidB-like acyl-CoA dehydrogenase
VNFDLTDEQAMLKASAERFVLDRYDLDKRKGYLRQPGGYARDNWQLMADLGLLALPFAESDGGLGGGPVEQMVVQEAFGAGLLAEPYFASIVLAGKCLARIGTDAQKSRWLPPLMDGSSTMTVAHAERDARYDLHCIATRAKKQGDDYSLTGSKMLVLAGDSADAAIVAARTAGAVREAHGISLFLVPLNLASIVRRPYRSVDGQCVAEITFRDVDVPADHLLGTEHDGAATLDWLAAQAALAVCFDSLGALQRLFDMTLEYVKTRTQFGVPIGTFQVIQHRMADCYMMLEQARSITLRAALANTADVATHHAACFGARAYMAEAALHIGHECLQFHGGMGMTDELAASHYHKRLLFMNTLFGDGAAYRQKYNTAMKHATASH